MMVRNIASCVTDNTVIMFDMIESVPSCFACKESFNFFFKLTSNIILTMKMCFIKNGVEYFFSKYVLNYHFSYIIRCEIRIYFLSAMLKKSISCFGVNFILFRLLNHQLT